MLNNFEDELDKIRVELYEEWKDLPDAELSKLLGEHAREIAEQYHIKTIAESPRKASPHESWMTQRTEE